MAETIDTLIRGARVVTPDGMVSDTDVAVDGGQIAIIGHHLELSAREEIDASDLLMLPGWIDAHVHFNEPGRDDWEGFATGSAALAAGGGTCFFDMPLNSTPPVLDADSFEEKRRLGESLSHLDFALWGGLTPDSLDHIEAMGDCGAVGFKAFMCPSGLDEFGMADAATLRAGMKLAAACGLPVAVHAEDPDFIEAWQASHPPRRPGLMEDWLDSRPVEAECRAIRTACEIAGETGCALHVVHVTSFEGLEIIAAARAAGVDVTAETCPHYLLLDRRSAITIGPAAKCAPPIRDNGTVAALWQQVLDGGIHTLGSDHSPSPPDMKTGDDVFSMWGGISGCQHGLPLLVDGFAVSSRLPRLAELTALGPARRFRLDDRKGGITAGMDADFCLWRRGEHTIAASDLLYRHAISPYVGMSPVWRPVSTWLRGARVGQIPTGKFLRPGPISG